METRNKLTPEIMLEATSFGGCGMLFQFLCVFLGGFAVCHFGGRVEQMIRARTADVVKVPDVLFPQALAFATKEHLGQEDLFVFSQALSNAALCENCNMAEEWDDRPWQLSRPFVWHLRSEDAGVAYSIVPAWSTTVKGETKYELSYVIYAGSIHGSRYRVVDGYLERPKTFDGVPYWELDKSDPGGIAKSIMQEVQRLAAKRSV